MGGNPLAIELSCAWLRLLEAAEIVAELDRSDALLRALDRDGPARHRSVEATLDTSWRLLDPATARVLEALSVFCGALDRAAAATVAGAELLTLGQLVDASMVHRSGAGFDVHPLIRQDARRRLELDPERRDRAWSLHAELVLGRLREAVTMLQQGTLSARLCMDRLSPVHADVIAAWLNAIRVGRNELLVAAAPALYRYLDLANRHEELVEALGVAASALERAGHGGLGLAVELIGAGAGAPQRRDLGALRPMLASVPEPLRTAAYVHGAIAHVFGPSPMMALEWADEAVARASAVDDAFLAGFSYAVRGVTRTRLGDLEGAAADLHAARRICREDRALGRVAVHLGELTLVGGRWVEAVPALEDAIRQCRLTDDRSFMILALGRLGQAMVALGEDPTDVCLEAIEEGVASCLHRVWWSAALAALAAFELAAGRPKQALFLLGALAARPSMLAPPAVESQLGVARGAVGVPADVLERTARSASDAEVLLYVRAMGR